VSFTRTVFHRIVVEYGNSVLIISPVKSIFLEKQQSVRATALAAQSFKQDIFLEKKEQVLQNKKTSYVQITHTTQDRKPYDCSSKPHAHTTQDRKPHD
jgi:hypothetical protein